jgi:hypothetical protein
VTVAVVTGGHPFEEAPFLEVFDDIAAMTWRHVRQPAATDEIRSGRLGGSEVIVFYDMAGITITRGDPPVVAEEPDPAVRAGFAELLAAGQPMVFLHHAIASWPAWPDYAEMIGGRFHYAPGSLGGVDYPASGYRHGVTHEIDVLDGGHPLCAGLPRRFTVTDETYLYPVLECDVVPLLRSNHTFTDDGFYSADLAVRGERDSRRGWRHSPGSDLVAWVKHAGPGPSPARWRG